MQSLHEWDHCRLGSGQIQAGEIDVRRQIRRRHRIYPKAKTASTKVLALLFDRNSRLGHSARQLDRVLSPRRNRGRGDYTSNQNAEFSHWKLLSLNFFAKDPTGGFCNSYAGRMPALQMRVNSSKSRE